ncbi:MAG: DUF4153 domain-containing protein [FCB group bacterium]|nr:DUF4153 domain-containing protein [FCB group bacterium]
MSILTRLPSSEYLYNSVISIFKRFPFASLCALFGTAMAINLTQSGDIAGEMIKQKLLMISALGLPLFIALTVFGESRNWDIQRILLVKFAAVIVMVIYYFSLPEQVIETGVHFLRYWLFLLGLHLLVAFLPFLRGKETGGFWQFNKTLFMRALLAALFTGVLYVGLLIALAAADNLFGMDVKEERYFQLWILIVGIFTTGIFLAGIPKKLNDLNGSIEYPKGLKIFTQYILLPLVTLYFVILIAYEGKIIATWNWPIGWVSHLVLWYSVVGIFSMLMLHPMRQQKGNLWIQGFYKWFFRTLIPLVVMLVLAILRRISDYGITENRYFVLGLAAGLIIVVVYFIFSRKRDIRIIPIVLCCLVFLSAFGPWSAFSVSKSSQLSRLGNLFTQNNLLIDGRVQKSSEELPFEDRQDISSILNYLMTVHGPESISPWFTDSALVALDSIPGYKKPMEVTDFIGFEYVTRWQKEGESSYISLSKEIGSSFALEDYDFLIDFKTPAILDSVLAVEIGEETCSIRLDTIQVQFEVSLSGDSNILKLPLTKPVLELMIAADKDALPPGKMTFIMPGDNFNALVIFNDISGSYWGRDSIKVNSLSGTLLIQKH